MTAAHLTCVSLLILPLVVEPGRSDQDRGNVPVIKAAGQKAKAHGKELADTAMSQDGRWLASASYDKTIGLWSLPAGDLVRTLTGHKDKVTSVTFSPDGRLLAAASEDDTVSVWTVDDGKQMTSLSPGQWPKSIRFSPDGRVLISETGSELKTWSMPDGKPIANVPRGSMGLDYAVFMPDGSMAFATKTGIQVLSLPDLQLKTSLICGDGEEVKQLALSADVGRLVAVCRGGLRVWSLPDRQLLTTISSDASRVTVLAVNSAATIAVTGEAPGAVRIWNLGEGRVGAPLSGHTSAVVSLALSKDGRLAASGSTDSTVRLWSTSDNTAIAVLEGHRGSIDHLHLTPDGTTLISGQESSFQMTGGSGNAISLKKITVDALIALWDVNPAKFRRFLGR